MIERCSSRGKFLKLREKVKKQMRREGKIGVIARERGGAIKVILGARFLKGEGGSSVLWVWATNLTAGLKRIRRPWGTFYEFECVRDRVVGVLWYG